MVWSFQKSLHITSDQVLCRGSMNVCTRDVNEKLLQRLGLLCGFQLLVLCKEIMYG